MGTPDGKRHASRLRKLLARDQPLFAPGCFDALSARLVEVAGFEAACISGFGVEVAHLGRPDMGLMTMTEMVGQAGRITATVDLPVIADIDTGFGGPHCIARAVRELERIGVAGAHIEDQAEPKRCPILPGRVLASASEAADRCAAAIEARPDTDFVVIARTDADAVSYDEMIERARLYLATGADLVMPMFVEYNGHSFRSLSPERQLEVVAQTVADIAGPVMYVGDAPQGYDYSAVAEAGAKLISASTLAVRQAATAIAAGLTDHRRSCFRDSPDDSPAIVYGTGRSLLDLMRVEDYVA